MVMFIRLWFVCLFALEAYVVVGILCLCLIIVVAGLVVYGCKLYLAVILLASVCLV